MTLITRMTRLFKADFHRVLDHMEEPDALLRQAIREMQDCLENTENSLAGDQQRDQQLSSRLEEIKESLVEIDTQLDLCFESDKEDLARGLVKRKLEAAALEKRLHGQQVTLRQSITQQQEFLAQNLLSLEHLRQKADALATSETSNAHWTSTMDSISVCSDVISVDDTDIDVALLREKKSRSTS